MVYASALRSDCISDCAGRTAGVLRHRSDAGRTGTRVWTLRPDFLIIGAEKAGTTWLHDVLRAHPDLFLPDTKELHFFNRFDSNGREIDTYARRGLDWYQRHFEAAERGKPAGEATPLYLCDPAAPRRIRRTLPEARFIVLLRDPVSRTWVALPHGPRQGPRHGGSGHPDRPPGCEHRRPRPLCRAARPLVHALSHASVS